MRQLVLLAAIPLAIGCAQQSSLRAPSLPTDEPLQVRLHQPTAGALHYTLSEPGYVAIFAVTRGHGISLLYPHYESQVDHRSHAGLNRETVHGGSAAWGYTGGGRNGHRALFGYADAYFVIASKYPLPVEGMIRSPYLLRGLVGADRFRASNLSETWDVLETILVEGLPDDAWASDVYVNWRDPFAMAYLEPRAYLEYCNDYMRVFYSSAFFNTGSCNANLRNTMVTPPIQVVGGPRRDPPKKPLDRDPAGWLPPDAGIARTSRLGNATIRGERTRRDAESSRAAIGRASDRSSDRGRSEPVRDAARPAPAVREQPPAPRPSRAAESRPQPSRGEGSRPQPQPDK